MAIATKSDKDWGYQEVNKLITEKQAHEVECIPFVLKVLPYSEIR